MSDVKSSVNKNGKAVSDDKGSTESSNKPQVNRSPHFFFFNNFFFTGLGNNFKQVTQNSSEFLKVHFYVCTLREINTFYCEYLFALLLCFKLITLFQFMQINKLI